MTGFNSQSQITVNWKNNGFDKVLSEIKQIEEAAKRLNISGATKKGADGMLRNVKNIDIAQQKLAQNAERLELARLTRVDKLNKEEYNRNKARNKELSRQYKENERNKKKELSDAKKLEYEKTKILNDAKTKQVFLSKQRATNERKEKLARDLKVIQEDRILTKHQRNIEIAERKKAFAEEEKLISLNRFDAAKRMQKFYIDKHGANSIEGINATNRRIEAENALSNKNSLLAKAGGNLSKARIASDEFNKKETERAQRLKDSETNKNLKETERAQRNYKKSEDLLNKSKDDMELSKAESEIRKKRMSEYDKDIQISKLERERHIKDLRESKKQISDQKKLLQKTNETDKDYIKIKTELNTLEANKNRIASRFHDSNSNVSDAKERKRVHQINRDAQFYTRANVALVAPAMIGAYNAMSALKDRERMDLVLIGMHGAENLKAEREKLLQVQYKSSLSLDNLIKVEQITGMYAKKEAQSGRTVNKDEVSQAMRDVLSLTTLNGRNVGQAIRQLQDITRQGYALPKKDLQVFLNNTLGLDFDAVYKKLYGKFYSGNGILDAKQVVDILVAAMKEPRALEQKAAQKSSYTLAEERLGETVHNLSGEFGKLLNETIGLTGKFNSASDSLDGLRKWFGERNPDGSPKTSQKALIGAAVAVAGTLLMGLFNSHKRKAMEFFFKGDDMKYNKRFVNSYTESRKAGNGVFASRAIGFRNSLGSVGSAAAGAAGSYFAYDGVSDAIAAKTLKDWGIASAEIIGGMTLLFGPAGIVAGIVTSLAIKTSSFLDSLENDKNSWWMSVGDSLGKWFHEMDRNGGAGFNLFKDPGLYYNPKANFDPNGKPLVELKTIQELAEQKNNAVKNAEIAKSKEAGEIKASFINAELKNSANAAKYKNETPVYLHNYINNTATSGISVKSDIETKQMGGQSYPSL